MDLTGKRALVCGASKGIGAEVAFAFAKYGAQVTMLARDEESLSKVLEKLPGDGHSYKAMDLTDHNALKEFLASETEQNNYHILVCNSGGPKGGPLIEASEEEFLMGFQSHLLANHIMVKALSPGMAEEGYGRVINIISTSVKVPIPNLGVSNTVRGAVASWAKTLANELGVKGITVNNVLPGFTNTERLSALKAAAAKRLDKTEEEIEQMWKNQVPVRRFGDPKETAEAVSFLASPFAGYISGVSLPVDGGRLGCL